MNSPSGSLLIANPRLLAGFLKKQDSEDPFRQNFESSWLYSDVFQIQRQDRKRP